jgi:hypothetical protein
MISLSVALVAFLDGSYSGSVASVSQHPLIYTNSVSQARLKPILLSPLPPQRNAERSLSSALRWRLVDGDQLILLHAAVRQRPQFDVSFMTQGQRSISLDHRSHNPASSSSDYGLTNGRPTIQTCLVLNPPLLPIATTNSDNLAMITDQRSRRLSQFALSLLGLKLSRDYQCLLVTLSSPSGRPVNIKIWKKVLERIQLAYRDSNLSSL